MIYITNYGFDNDDQYLSFPSAVNKSKYISNLLNKLSLNWTNINPLLVKQGQSSRKKRIISGEYGEKIVVSPAIRYKGTLSRVFAKSFQQIWLLCYLLFHVKYRETVIVYHSPSRMLPVILLWFFKRINLILELEEIYTLVDNSSGSFKKKIELLFIQFASGYILPSSNLFSFINDKTKKYCTIEGNCAIEPKVVSIHSDKIRIVYAGILNEYKGVGLVTDLPRYLSDNYEILIIGYGSDEEINKLNKKITSSNLLNKCQIRFDGLLTGADYIKYLQTCDIGLCPQIDDYEYNFASFPSKISSYLANGLEVIATDTYSLRTSRFADYLTLCSNDPLDVSSAIYKVCERGLKDNRTVLRTIQMEHVHDLGNVLIPEVV